MILIKKLVIKNFAYFDDQVVHFYRNTILLGGNNSGKTRILKIIENIINNTLQKSEYAKSSSNNESKISATFTIDGKNIHRKYSVRNNKLELDKDSGEFPEGTLGIFIPAKYINSVDIINEALKQKYVNWPEYIDFTNRIKLEVNAITNAINDLPKIDKHEICIVSGDENITIPKAKQLNREITINDVKTSSSIEFEGDGFNKYISVGLLKSKSNSEDYTKNTILLIDEIENHFSKKTIEIFLGLVKNVQFICTSHRVEITSHINSVFLINDISTIDDISITMDRAIERNVIFLEGKNDFPPVALSLQNRKIDGKILFSASGKDNIEKLIKKFDSAHCIKDRDQRNDTQNNLVTDKKTFFTRGFQMENYVTNDDFARIFKIPTSHFDINSTIDDMIKNNSLDCKENQFKEKISNDDNWVVNSTLPKELETWINSWQNNNK